MPPGGVRARASSLGLIHGLIYERRASGDMARLLDRLEGRCEPGSFEDSVVRAARRQHDLAVKLPPALMGDRSSLSAEARPVWRRARAEADWPSFAPFMSRVVDINREIAEAIGYAGHPCDALLELTDPGMTVERLWSAFAEIQSAVGPLLEAARSEPGDRASGFLVGEWDRQAQMDFIRLVAGSVGVPGESGRIDLSAYPIANKIGAGDVRMTTNMQPDNLTRGIFGALHELGHVIYALGLDPVLEETPLWGSPSFGLDESQSRLCENLLGKSRAFWRHWLPYLQRTFPGRLDGLDVDDFYLAVNRVKTTPILLDADELTYNLHILVRFEIECGLLDGSLAVHDVPELWRAGMSRYLDVTVRDDGEGPLQDIHWAGCYVGAFTSYTIGDLVAAQLMASARRGIPDLDDHIAAGDPGPLVGWLRANVHSHGARHSPDELIERATGEELSTAPWISYIRAKSHDLELLQAR